MASDTSIEARAVMNQILSTKTATLSETPTGNVARVLTPGEDISPDAAYAQLVAADLAPAPVPPAAIRDALAANVVNGRVGGIPTARLNTDAARATAYAALAAQGGYDRLAEDIPHHPVVLAKAKAPSVLGHNPCGILPTVLE